MFVNDPAITSNVNDLTMVSNVNNPAITSNVNDLTKMPKCTHDEIDPKRCRSALHDPTTIPTQLANYMIEINTYALFVQ